MDRFEKWAEYIMKHGDKILEEKKHRNMFIRRVSFSCASAFAAAIVGFYAWKSIPHKPEFPNDFFISQNTEVVTLTSVQNPEQITTSVVSKVVNSSKTTMNNIATTSGTHHVIETSTIASQTTSVHENEKSSPKTDIHIHSTTPQIIHTQPITVQPTDPSSGPENAGSPGAVHTVLNVSYDEAKEKFGHSIKECTGSDFLGYKVGIVSKNGNINSNESFCLDLTYNFTNGQIFIQDQDRSAGKLANPGIEQYDYLGRIFVKEESYDDEHIIIGYYPTDMDGIAYRASFPKSVDMYEIMDKIISIEI